MNSGHQAIIASYLGWQSTIGQLFIIFIPFIMAPISSLYRAIWYANILKNKKKGKRLVSKTKLYLPTAFPTTVGPCLSSGVNVLVEEAGVINTKKKKNSRLLAVIKLCFQLHQSLLEFTLALLLLGLFFIWH